MWINKVWSSSITMFFVSRFRKPPRKTEPFTWASTMPGWLLTTSGQSESAGTRRAGCSSSDAQQRLLQPSVHMSEIMCYLMLAHSLALCYSSPLSPRGANMRCFGFSRQNEASGGDIEWGFRWRHRRSIGDVLIELPTGKFRIISKSGPFYLRCHTQCIFTLCCVPYLMVKKLAALASDDAWSLHQQQQIRAACHGEHLK